ncbi:Pr6Pr family membrane protein [Microbacterium sp. Sa4CUA7]|uniref:Pr6Pr family membrane protein n=1 Tax=Microbacterium pullorum TaxID=2762236 RepID=A0ABR8S595_9MICO|nr:Pr6Pr family membrane protein [Microbacterium pullorum]MBD7958644.1 Pr6Pr family membrane protein [Microbacterium pullorum]
MIRTIGSHRAVLGIGIVRISAAAFVVVLLLHTFAGRIAVGDDNPFDYFGYFTNQTSLLAALVLVATGSLSLRNQPAPQWLVNARGIVTAYLVVVAVIYNGLVPGTGTAPAWVSAVLHMVFPMFVLLDWVLIGDRAALQWRTLWIVLPYPLAWLGVVLIRGATDGWVPYGFLLPERGVLSLTGYSTALLLTLLAAGAVVWVSSRSRGIFLRRSLSDSLDAGSHPER